MVYFEDWSQFKEAGRQLYINHPLQTRYQVKIRKCDQKAVVKITNDRVTLKYKTDQQSCSSQIQDLSKLFLTWMSEPIVDENLCLELPEADVVMEPVPKQQATKHNKKKGRK
eukprot:Platyproteum_vivax@DN13502_c0_g1_i1.p1